MNNKIKKIIIRATEKDNVGIVAHPQGLSHGTVILDDITVLDEIPMGHKVALKQINENEPIVRYGSTIAYADRDIWPGQWVSHENISLPPPPKLNDVKYHKRLRKKLDPIDGYTFLGFKNDDGSVGTKNVLALTTSVQCVAGLTQFVVNKIKNELLPFYPNVDDVVALNHSYGCGVAINAPGAIVPIRTIKNIALNPNFGGEVLVIGLGCEKLRPETLVPTNENKSSILYMQDNQYVGFEKMVEGVMELAKKHLKRLNVRQRELCPASELVVGMQCGGSDAFSGMTANPVAGYAADLIVRAGGSVLFSEVTEVRDAIQTLVDRAVDQNVADALIREMRWYDEYLLKGHADRSANPSPGNKKGGLSTIVEKALGSIAKSGTSTIVDVLGPGERVQKKGLIFAATPASDFVCGTLQLASGMNMHLFMTGRGSPYGLSMVPVIKIGSNSVLSERWYDLIDFDAGQVATGEKTIEELGWELFHLIIDVASGKKIVACDRLGLHNDLVLFNPGPLT